MDTLADLLEDELKDLYNAENQLSKVLPRLAKKASSKALKAAFTGHLAETEKQIKRLEQIGEKLDIKLKGKVCHAMKGLIEEGEDVLSEDGDDSVIDVALVGAARRVEHYEIAAYTTVIGIAEQLGHKAVVELLQKTLDEESACDVKLDTLVGNDLLPAATAGGDAE